MARIDDMIAALQCRQPSGAVPVWELEFHLWDAFSGKHLVLGQEFAELSAAAQERALHDNAEIILSMSQQLGFAAVSTPTPPWEQAPGVPAYYILPGGARFTQLERLRHLAGDDLMLVGHATAVLAANYSEEFCTALFQSPEEIDAMARLWLSAGLETARRLRDLGADAVFTASDLADNSGPFFKIEQMQRFILPYLDRWASQCKTMGLYTILHTDGKLPPSYLDAIAETAVDALQAIDPVAGMDMATTKAIVRDRLCLCGNVDCGLLVEVHDDVSLSALVGSPSLRRPLIIGCLLMILGALSGINAIMYYAPKIFQTAGLGAHGAHSATVVIGVFNIIFTVLALLWVDRLGRRPLMLGGVAGVLVALIAVGAVLHFHLENPWWVLVPLLMHVAFFAFSYGPGGWIITSEIFPTRVRGRASSVAVFCGWSAGFLLAQTFPRLLATFGGDGTFWLYAGVTLLALVFVWKMIPETKGKSLEEIERHWTGAEPA